MRVKVFVVPRQGVLDPQGRAVERALKSLGFDGVSAVHVGKFITMQIEASSLDEARSRVGQMCERLLANPLIEDYQFEVGDE